LPGFSPKNLYLYKKGNDVIGTLGVWDQQSFKQTVVTHYSARMRLARPLYNVIAQLRSYPALPKIGDNIRFIYASLVSSTDDDPEILESLINKTCSDWSGRGHDYLLLGFSEENKLSTVSHRLASRALSSKIYLVHWQEDRVSLPDTKMTPHLEVALL
jgi:hypothetical protein